MAPNQPWSGATGCACPELADFAAIRMGDHEGLDQRVFSSLENLKDHGDRQWWLYAARCASCNQAWMIAQEERIHDNYYLKRISAETLTSILQQDDWPPDFLRFEDVIRLGPDHEQVCYFMNPSDLNYTVKELIWDRPDITSEDIAYLLCLSRRRAERLLRKARGTGWAWLRPFA